MGDRARNQRLAFGELQLLRDAPLVVVAGIGCLEGIGAGADGEDEVEDLLELQVGEARAKVDPVTGVVADTLLGQAAQRSEEHTSELQSLRHLVCRLLLEKKNKNKEEHATKVTITKEKRS